ncbi:MAG: Gfo/Idh/MocA family oxidoreductase [Acidobacteria bacterium]|nr:Gfo/Idh/MocA family oxidoreductase [Acidobacteriota bacterium]
MSSVRVALIGCGSVGRRIHAAGLRLCPEVELALACSRSLESAESIGAPEATQDYREVMAREDIDAVVIATPNNLHREIALAAFAAGKHVLCEKPLALNGAEAREMRDAATASGKVHMTAFTYEFIPAVRHLKKLIDRGELGEIRSVRGAYLMALAGHTLGWRSTKAQAGCGVLGDIGSHLIHLCHWLAGDIARLTATERKFRDDPNSDVEDWIAFLAEFESGAVGTFELSRICPGRGADITEEMTIEVYGTKGGALMSMADPRAIWLTTKAAAMDPASRLERMEIPESEWKLPGAPRELSEGYPRWSYRYDQAFQFIRAIREQVAAEPTFDAGYRTQQVLDAALKSAQSRRWTDVR